MADSAETFPNSGFETVQGRRWNMEDAHLNIDSLPALVPGAPPMGVYAVFDGHGGKRAAIYAEETFVRELMEAPGFKEGHYLPALSAAYLSLDRKLIDMLTPGSNSHNGGDAASAAGGDGDTLPAAAAAAASAATDSAGPPPSGGNDGSTAVTLLVDRETLYIANAGDSEAVLARRQDVGKCTDLVAILLSQKHTPHDDAERARIEAAGATVTFNRVNGVLAVSRGFGDKEFKKPFNKKDVDFVLAQPYTAAIPLTKDDEFVILACDGVWDTVTYERAVDVVATARWNGASAMQAAEKLVAEALETRSTDNITAIVIYLREAAFKKK